MKTHDEIIAGYKEKIKLTQAKKKKSEARQKALAKKTDKQDQQRLEHLVGVMLLKRVKAGTWPVTQFEIAMGEFLVNENDLVFFQRMADKYQPPIELQPKKSKRKTATINDSPF